MGSMIGGIGGMIGGSAGNFASDNQGMLSPATLLGMNNPFKAKSANLINGVTGEQANTAYNNAQSGLTQQQAFLNALAGQNGIGNQSSVFGQMQGLAGQLQGMSNGTGPNPAMAMLHNATGQNIASQAALMAGQRGSSANAGLIARQAGQQGAGIQQQAIGQGAQMQAQQQLAALAALQQQQQMMGGLATQQVGQHANALTGYNQFAQNEQSNILNGINGLNAANVNMTANMNNVNSGVASQNAQANQALIGGALNSGGSMMSMLAHGGMAGRDGYADGGGVQLDPDKVKQFMQGFGGHPAPKPAPKPQMMADGGMSGPQSFVGQYLAGSFSPTPVTANAQYDIGQTPKMDIAPQLAQFGQGGGGGGGGGKGGGGMAALALLSQGGSVGDKMKRGGKVPGEAEIAGDSPTNDTVSAKLSPGEIVIPRHITMAPDAPKKAAAFVAAVLARKGGARGKG